MAEYEVVVTTRVREVYMIEAESEEAARESWSDGELWSSECIEVEGVKQVKEVSDDQ